MRYLNCTVIVYTLIAMSQLPTASLWRSNSWHQVLTTNKTFPEGVSWLISTISPYLNKISKSCRTRETSEQAVTISGADRKLTVMFWMRGVVCLQFLCSPPQTSVPLQSKRGSPGCLLANLHESLLQLNYTEQFWFVWRYRDMKLGRLLSFHQLLCGLC